MALNFLWLGAKIGEILWVLPLIYFRGHFQKIDRAGLLVMVKPHRVEKVSRMSVDGCRRRCYRRKTR